MFNAEVQSIISSKNGFKMFERISKFALIENPFVVGETLSAKQEIMRHKIADKYEKEIKNLF